MRIQNSGPDYCPKAKSLRENFKNGTAWHINMATPCVNKMEEKYKTNKKVNICVVSQLNETSSFPQTCAIAAASSLHS